MPHWNDTLGDAMKAIEGEESLRRAESGSAVVVRVDGVSFSKFTKGLHKPFDARMSQAMVAAASAVVEDFKCRIAYTQSDEASFLFAEPQGDLPFGGRLQKFATRVASKFGAAFLLKALELFPEAVSRQVPEFDGRATAFPSFDLAAKNVLWRELDGRRNAISMLAQSRFSHSSLQGRSTQEMKAMLAEVGVDGQSMSSAFRRGVFVRRVTEERYLTEAELALIPEAHRPTGPVRRSRVAELDLPALSSIDNLVEVLFDGGAPKIRQRDEFSLAVNP